MALLEFSQPDPRCIPLKTLDTEILSPCQARAAISHPPVFPLANTQANISPAQ
jgi:hypothetical protein